MLEKSSVQLTEASAEERGTAETLAAAWMTSMLEQDLIPIDEAERVVAEHRTNGTEEWIRSVYAALVGLRAVGRLDARPASDRT